MPFVRKSDRFEGNRVTPTNGITPHVTDNVTDNVTENEVNRTEKLRGYKNGEPEDSPAFETIVPRAGVEPARVAPLVFETSASTDSAIWALHLTSKAVQRYYKNLKLQSFMVKK